MNYQPAMALVEMSRISLESGEKLLDLGFRQFKDNLANSSALIGELGSAEPQAYADLAISQVRKNFSNGLAQLTELTNVVTRTQASLLSLAGKTWQANTAK